MAMKMFCGELNGVLKPAYLDIRAKDVRYSLAYDARNGESESEGWAAAKKIGWKIVPVIIKRVN